ncbi:MAG: TIGR03943 family putative permease subunit, partial [Actinomycetota bacterium]
VELTRFYVSCCAADAIPHSAIVVPSAERRYSTDTWLEVSGELHERDGRWVVVASEVVERPAPDDPYLY